MINAGSRSKHDGDARAIPPPAAEATFVPALVVHDDHVVGEPGECTSLRRCDIDAEMPDQVGFRPEAKPRTCVWTPSAPTDHLEPAWRFPVEIA